MRTHVLLPRDVVEEIDQLVGNRQRSEFIAAAAREKLERERRTRTLKRYAGWLKGKDVPPEWETPESAAQWVHDLRRVESATVDPDPSDHG